MSADPGPDGQLDRVVLVGFMGSGKTTVGRAVARALGWRFVDLDDEIVREEGMAVPDVFRALGESHFRSVEARLGSALLMERSLVLSTGGGWAVQPGRLDEVPPGTETFWLRVSAEEAVRRTSAQAGSRPLLEVENPLGRAVRLLAEREPRYREADHVVDTDGRSVEDVTTEVLAILGEEHPEVPRGKA